MTQDQDDLPSVLQQQALLVKKNSLTNPDRQHCTHAVPQLVELMKRVPLEAKVKKNYAIEVSNIARKEKDIEFLEKTDVANIRPGSPQQSEWTYTEDQEKTLRTRECYDRLKKWLSMSKIAQIEEDMQKAAEKDTSTTSSSRNTDTASKGIETVSAPDVVERTRDDTVARAPTFPDFLFNYANYAHTAPISLGLFTRENLEFINSKQHLLHFEKKSVPGIKGNVRVLEMDKLIKLRGIVTDGLEGLTFSGWSSAVDNWLAFEKLREVKAGKPLHAEWAEKHVEAFEAIPDKEATYSVWKVEEQRLREERYAFTYAFDKQDYLRAQDRIASDYKNDKRFADLEERLKDDREAKRRRGTNDYRGRSSEPSKPFSSGSRDNKPRVPCCLVCCTRGHRSDRHDSSHPSPLWVKLDGSKIIHPTNKKPICVNWNIHGNKCREGCSFEHLCTFCGRADHHAFSWTCKEKLIW
ncbi:hypothetical protein AAF712_006315 [Marasmius tenuissimus]|uniref:C3H1-type domain-containing protein n=1 Tax=Marasmius tenuissimus TaxID=585030 RepID=A0ABR2ZZK8_9AGAR